MRAPGDRHALMPQHVRGLFGRGRSLPESGRWRTGRGAQRACHAAV